MHKLPVRSNKYFPFAEKQGSFVQCTAHPRRSLCPASSLFGKFAASPWTVLRPFASLQIISGQIKGQNSGCRLPQKVASAVRNGQSKCISFTFFGKAQ